MDRNGPTLLALEVARRYHVDGWSKVEISRRTGISRFKVARLLDRARESGWVRIEIDAPENVDVDLSDELCRIYGLRHAVVVCSGGAGSPRDEVAAAAARFLEEALTPRDTVGLAWSRTASAAVDRLRRVPACPVVQLTGALPQTDPDGGSIELVRRFAARSGAPAYLYYAPMILTSKAAATAMRRQPEIARTVDLLPRVTVAIVAVGAWQNGMSTVHACLSPAERQEAAAAGVVAEISGILIDEAGRTPATSVSGRILCPDAKQLRRVPDVIALVSGDKPPVAVRAALLTGLVDTLIIHADAAAALLAQAPPDPA